MLSVSFIFLFLVAGIFSFTGQPGLCSRVTFSPEQTPLPLHVYIRRLTCPPPFPPTQVVERLRERVASVVDKDHRGYSNSSYVGIDPNAYDVWKSRDFWVVPWLREAVEKEESVAGGGSIVGAAGSGVVGAGNT